MIFLVDENTLFRFFFHFIQLLRRIKMLNKKLHFYTSFFFVLVALTPWFIHIINDSVYPRIIFIITINHHIYHTINLIHWRNKTMPNVWHYVFFIRMTWRSPCCTTQKSPVICWLFPNFINLYIFLQRLLWSWLDSEFIKYV